MTNNRDKGDLAMVELLNVAAHWWIINCFFS